MKSNGKQIEIQANRQKDKLLNGKGDISLTSLLESDIFQDTIVCCREFRARIYTPFVTLIIFIKQVLNPDKSCKRAVANFVVEQLDKGNNKTPSINTGPYCDSRKRLPEPFIHELVKISGSCETKEIPNGWKIYGREVKSIDGTTVNMPDTPENQSEYPQHGQQKEGVGFPLARLVVVMSLTLGTVVDYAIGAHKGKGTGEQTLYRKISDCIQLGDIGLADCYYPSFFFMADFLMKQADAICAAQRQRRYDFRKGKSLGKNDHVVEWSKPRKPNTMSQEEYDKYPDQIKVREFKVKGVIYVTTFLNHKKYPKKELAHIYKMRWHIEINLNSIKNIMNMCTLSCKSPEMVRKEIGIHFLAYNLIRILIAEACMKHDCNPSNISFKGAVQLLNEFIPRFSEKNTRLYEKLLFLITKNKVGNRPGRIEPRLVKSRPKPFKRLQNPRNIEREKILEKVKKRKEHHDAAA